MIAEVIVDISNSEVDRIFDYLVNIPSVKIGSRVHIPFANRTIEGYVIKLKEETSCPPEKLKEIIETLDDFPVLTEEMLALKDYMTKKYHLRTVDVLRLFIPSQMRGGRIKALVKQFAFVNPEFLQRDPSVFIKPNATSQMDIFNFLVINGRTRASEINKDFSAAALRNLVSRDIVKIDSEEVNRTPYDTITEADKCFTLTEEQEIVVNAVNNSLNQSILLHGITGSGKTEVYMHCISKVLSAGKTAIMLVPEISLTPQVLGSFRRRFGEDVAILHSGLSAGERFDEWRRLLSGEARVAVGARSAIFAPLQNLGLIIIDEEHDSSYVSESNPRYITMEVAEFRKTFNNANLIMGSATPSIDSYYKAKSGQIALYELKKRVNKRELPKIEIVNMCEELYRGNNSVFSKTLQSELYDCVEKGNQAIIFLNRRGYSSFVRCNSCGYVAKCTDCDVSLVYHREDNILKCHYCNKRYNKLDVCPECKSPHIRQGFVGTEQIVEQLSKMFSGEKILRMDNDTTQTKDAHAKILAEFSSKRASILVGTQMIAKGHDFPDVTLVGIIDADMSLHFSDFRSSERTFQLITQVSGRAGRENKVGKVVLQTYTPNHYVFKFACANDYLGFYDKECNLREVTKYPPFSTIVRILISSEVEELASNSLKTIFEEVQQLQTHFVGSFAYLSAMRSPVKRIQNKFRMQILMRIENNFDEIIYKIYDIMDKNNLSKVRCFVEINPNNLS